MGRTGFLGSVTAKIILVNVVVFILIFIIEAFFGAEIVRNLFALQPTAIMNGEKLWTLFTSMFAHEAVWHIFANMFSLYFLGSMVEKLIGKRRFLVIYIVSGLFAGLFWSVLSVYLTFGDSILLRIIGGPGLFGLGASGAIFGLLGILAVLTPRSKIYFLAGPLIAILAGILIRGIDLPSQVYLLVDVVVMIYIFYSVYLMITFNPRGMKFLVPIKTSMAMMPLVAIIPLVIVTLFIDLPIGNMAHLGGLIAGLLYGYYLVTKYPKRSKMISRMFR